jgi:hypothetical protein
VLTILKRYGYDETAVAGLVSPIQALAEVPEHTEAVG